MSLNLNAEIWLTNYLSGEYKDSSDFLLAGIAAIIEQSTKENFNLRTAIGYCDGTCKNALDALEK